MAPHGLPGGSRLQALDEENTRLLEETRRAVEEAETAGRARREAESTEEIITPAAPETTAKEPLAGKVFTPRRVTSEIPDPLQLGLDQVKKTASPLWTVNKNTSAAQADTPTYADAMARSGGEEEALSDTTICLCLGYDESLRHAAEQKRVESIRQRTFGFTRKHREEPSESEYTGPEDTIAVLKRYKRMSHRNGVRVLIAIVGLAIALLYDLIPLLLTPHDLQAVSDPALYAPVGILWALLVCIPFIPRLGKGMRALWRFEPTTYSVAAVAVTVALIEGVVACFVKNPHELPLFFGSALVSLLVAALSEMFVTQGEKRAFSVVSSGKTAYVLTDEPTPASAAHTRTGGKASDKGDAVSLERRSLTAVRTGRVADYFARTRRYNPYMGRLTYLLPAAFLLALLCGALTLLKAGAFGMEILRVMTATYLICLPATYLVALTLPLPLVNRLLLRKGAAVIGTEAPMEYTDKAKNHLIFSDGDALRFLHRKDITLRGDEETETWQRLADVVFRMLDTPLSSDASIRELLTDGYRLDIVETDERYLRLYLIDTENDRTTEVMLGSHDALTRRGIRLPKINMEQRYKKSENSHVVYLAFNRSFHLAYAAEYRVGLTFARSVTYLSELGYRVSLASYDPLLDPHMEGLSLLRERHGVRVLRPTAYEPVQKIRSAGVVATGRGLDLLYPLAACQSMRLTYRIAHVLAWLSLILGGAMSAVLICLAGAGGLSSLPAVLWQMISCGAMLLVTRLCVNKNNLYLPVETEIRTPSTVAEDKAKPQNTESK